MVVSLPSAKPWQSLHWASLYFATILVAAALNFLSLGAPSWQAVHLAPLTVVGLAEAIGATARIRAAVRRVMRRMETPEGGRGLNPIRAGLNRWFECRMTRRNRQ